MPEVQIPLLEQGTCAMTIARADGLRYCYYCKEEKKLDDFITSKACCFGRGYICKPCAVIRDRKWRQALPPEKRKLGYRKRSYVQKERNVTRWQFRHAVKLGLIARPPRCSICEVECEAHGHHEDYEKPYDVVWLCRRCHQDRHNYLKARASRDG